MDFLIEHYTILNSSVIFLAATFGVFLYKKYQKIAAKYFIYFLVYAAFVDLLGNYPQYIDDYDFLEGFYNKISDTLFINNYWWYTLFWAVGSALFFALFFNKILKNNYLKSILFYLSMLLIVVTTINIIFNFEAFMTSFVVSIEVLCFLIIIVSCAFYLIELLSSSDVLKFYKSIYFYITVTILLWWLITTPLMFYDVYFTREDTSFFNFRLITLLFSNIFMYLTFTFALLWCKPQNS